MSSENFGMADMDRNIPVPMWSWKQVSVWLPSPPAKKLHVVAILYLGLPGAVTHGASTNERFLLFS